MPVGRVDWRVRLPFGDIEIELHPVSVDAATREASVREVRRLVDELRQRQPLVRRVVLEVYARVRGLSATTSPRDDVVGEELLAAARAGILGARRIERRAASAPLDAPSEPVLGPESSQDVAADTKSWVGLTLVDQTGTPVPNRPYRVVKPDGTTVDGTLDSNGAAMLKDLDPGNCQIWCPYVEPHPETTYAVKDGDHVSGVARRFGFDDYTVVWNDPANADLKSLRSDPHVLQPDDQLTIPEVKAQPAANKPTGAKHPFTIQQSPLKVRLTLLDLRANPVKGAAVTVGGTDLTTDGSGLVEATIDKGASGTTIKMPGGDGQLEIGALNLSDDTTEAGYKARLANLGFLWDTTVEDTDGEMVFALQDFQAEYSLPMSGQLDDATKAQVLQVYGC